MTERKHPVQAAARVYFTIVADDFDPQEISERLGLEPSSAWAAEDPRPNGSLYGFARWNYGDREEKVWDVAELAEPIVDALRPRIPILREIKRRYNAALVLEIVVRPNPNENPSVCLGDEIVEFLYRAGAVADIDMHAEERNSSVK